MMNRAMKWLLFICTFVGISCTKQPSTEKPLVMVSIAPYQFFVQEIAQDLVEVRSVVPPGINSHAFEPAPRSQQRAMDAFVFFTIGESFEQKLIPAMKRMNSDLQVVNLQKNLPKIFCDNGCFHDDIHTWLDPLLVEQQAKIIFETLADFFPEHRNFLERNFHIFVEKLQGLDETLHALLSPVDKRILLTSHASFAYFCHRYDLHQIAIAMEGKEFLPKTLSDIVAKKEEIAIVIFMPEFNNRGAKMVADRYDLPVAMVDPYSVDYFKMMKHLGKSIANGAKK